MRIITIFVMYMITIHCIATNIAMNINDLIHLACSQSADYKIYKIQKEMDVRNFNSSMHHYSYSLDLDFQPQFNRSISQITQPNGTVVNHDVVNFSVTPILNFSIPISFTGGSISLTGNFNYYTSKNLEYTSSGYSVNLFHIDYSQPLQKYSATKWGIKNAKANFWLHRYENVMSYIKLKSKLCDKYFEVLKNKCLVKNLNSQIANLDTLVILYTDLYEHGQILKIELDNIKYSRLETKEKLRNYQSGLRYSVEDLNQFLNKTIDMDTINLEMPKNLRYIDFNTVKSLLSRKQMEYNEAAKIPLLKNILETKTNKGIQVSFNAGFGINSYSDSFSDILKKRSPNMNILINIKVPISDLKERSNQYKLAKLEKEKYEISSSSDNLRDLNNLEQIVEHYNYLIDDVDFLNQKENYIKNQIQVKEQLLKSKKILFDEYSRSWQIFFENITQKISAVSDLYKCLFNLESTTLYNFIDGSNYYEDLSSKE